MIDRTASARNQALQALDDLQASGRLSRFHEAVAGARGRANPGDIIGTLTAALSILSRACPPNFITGATYELGMIEASKGAVALAARDCVLAEDRRFRPPELCELIAAATKREEELSALAGNLKFLMGRGSVNRRAWIACRNGSERALGRSRPCFDLPTLLRGSKVVATA